MAKSRSESYWESLALFENCSQQSSSKQPGEPGANLPGKMGNNNSQTVCTAELVGTYPNRVKAVVAAKLVLPSTFLKGSNTYAGSIFHSLNFLFFFKALLTNNENVLP